MIIRNADINFFRSKIPILILFLVFSYTSLFAQYQGRIFRQGKILAEYGFYLEALYRFNSIIKEDSSISEVNLQASMCYLELHKPNEALKLIKKISDGDDCINYYEALCYYKLEQFNVASRVLESVDSVTCQHKYTKDELKNLIEIAEYRYKNARGYVVQNFGPNINSENREYCAVMLNKYDSVLFTLRQTDIRDVVAEDGLGYESIYGTTVDKDQNWSTPSKLKLTSQSDRIHHATVQVVKDGEEVILFRDGDLYRANKVNDKWIIEDQLNAVNTTGTETHCFLTSDQNTIYFSSDHLSDDENLDLFMTNKAADGTWSEPVALDALNTPYDEDAPFISEDGTFYFCSKGHTSIGGFDVFSTRYYEESGTWGAIENLGHPINTVADDIYYNTFGKVGYLSSSRKDGMGMLDIYQVLLFNKIKVEGQVISSTGNLPVPGANIDVSYGPWFLQAYSDYEGNYEMYVPVNKNMKITIHKDTVNVLDGNFIVKISFADENNNRYDFMADLGYNESGEPVISKNASGTSDKPVHINLQVKNDLNKNDLIRNITGHDEKGWVDSLNVLYNQRYIIDSTFSARLRAIENMQLDSVLAHVYFDFNEYELTDSIKMMLNNCKDVLAAAHYEHIEVRGHTDAVGSDTYNQVLSIKRAEAVSQYLTDMGVAVDKMIVKGLGEKELIESNEGRSATNRRVDLIIRMIREAYKDELLKEFNIKQ